MPSTFLTAVYIILGSIGTINSYYIYHKKIRNQPLVCNIIGKNCNKVIRSKYGSVFGIDNTLFGILYYAGIALYGLGSIFFSNLAALEPYVFWATAGAALFSAYLLYAQIFVLKEYCQYCLLSALLSIIIFLAMLLVDLGLVLTPKTLTPLLLSNHTTCFFASLSWLLLLK